MAGSAGLTAEEDLAASGTDGDRRSAPAGAFVATAVFSEPLEG
jgi:hypothetical protein